MTAETDQEIRGFIAHYIDSVGVLEVILLLQKDKNKYWTAKEISDELRSSEFAAIQQLNALFAKGVAAKHPENQQLYCLYRSAKLEAIAQKLADVYANHRISVISLIYDRKSNTLQSFADAFLIKKDN